MKRPRAKQQVHDVVELRGRARDPRNDPQATQKISREELNAVLRRSSGTRPRVQQVDTTAGPPPAGVEPRADVEPEAIPASSIAPDLEPETFVPLRTPTPHDDRSAGRGPLALRVMLACFVIAIVGLLGFLLGRASH